MTSAIQFSAVILAAGASTRMGRDKAQLPWPPASPTGTLLAAAILALRPFAATVIVVAGDNAGNLAPIIAEAGALLVRNPARTAASSAPCKPACAPLSIMAATQP